MRYRMRGKLIARKERLGYLSREIGGDVIAKSPPCESGHYPGAALAARGGLNAATQGEHQENQHDET